MFNWREVPFVRLLMPLLLGIAVALYVNIPLHFLNIVILLFFIAIIFLANRKLETGIKDLFSILVHLILLLVGYQLTIYQNDFHKAQHFRHSLSKENTIIGTVTSVKSSGRFLNTNLAVEQIKSGNDTILHRCGNIMLSIDQAELKEAPEYGDRLIVSAYIKELEGPKNPAAFDYRLFLRMKGIYHQAFVKGERWAKIETGTGNPLLAWTGTLRAELLKTLRLYLPTENEYAVGAAMLLGFRDGMNEEIKNAYAGTGATHVMAVSGLHIGLVFLGLGLLLRLLLWRNKFMRFFKPCIMLTGIWLFALLSGASPSAMRAAFMFSLIIVSQSLNREGSIYNTLASSAFCLLIYNPFLLMEVGFQLSYLAVTGIVYFQPKIYKLWFIENKIGNYLWQMASVGLAAQLITFPLSIFYFHQFPVYFWLSGLIVVPAATFIIGLGALLFLSHYYLPFLSFFVGKTLWWVITLMNGMIFLIRKLPAGLIDGIWIGFAVFILLYLVISTSVIAINSKQSRWAMYALGFFVLAIGISSFTDIQQQQQTSVVFYHSPKNTLIDFIDGQSVVTFKNESLSQKKKNRAAGNHQASIGIDNVEEFLLQTDTTFEKGPLKYQKPFVQFHEHRFALIDQLPFQKPEAPIEVDFLLLYNNPQLKLSTLLEYFDFDTLIIGSSNTRKQTERWIDDCKASGKNHYSISKSGAFIFTPNQTKQ
jgi:competence protein ComEC